MTEEKYSPSQSFAADATHRASSDSGRISKRIVSDACRHYLGRAIPCVLCFVGALALAKFLMHALDSSASRKIPAAVVDDLVCDRPVWQLGTVNATHGATLTHEFELHNKSNDTAITLTEVQSNCGCVVAEHPKVIQPLESVELPVTLSIPPMLGAFRQRLVVVQANQPQPLVLTIEGKRIIDGELEAIPSVVTFGTVRGQKRSVRTLYVQRRDQSAVRVKSVASSEPGIRTRVKSAKAKRVEIEVELLETFASRDESRHRSTILIRTAGDRFNELEVPVTASLNRDENPFVDSIFVARLEPGASSQHPLFTTGPESARVESISFVGHNGLRVELVNGEGNAPHVRVSRNRVDELEGLIRGNIRVRLQDAPNEFVLPLTAFCVNLRSRGSF